MIKTLAELILYGQLQQPEGRVEIEKRAETVVKRAGLIRTRCGAPGDRPLHAGAIIA